MRACLICSEWIDVEMPRRYQDTEHENNERWVVSYADFITLLFAFFVVMYSVSSVNEGKYKVLITASTRSRVKDVLKGAVMQELEDFEVAVPAGDHPLLNDKEMEERRAENSRACNHFSTVFPTS